MMICSLQVSLVLFSTLDGRGLAAKLAVRSIYLNIYNLAHLERSPCISPPPVSALWPSAIWLILVSQVDLK